MSIPKLLCVGWYSLDVLFTSSTIIHLCMISIDRYMTLTYPLRYGHAKKKTHTIVKIALVWVISFCIAGPLFVLSMWDQHVDSVEYKGCGPETPTFVISATVTSFYLPLAIMTVMYALTVRALQQQLREQRRMTVTNSSRHGSRQPGDWNPNDTGSLQRHQSFRGSIGFNHLFRRSPRASLSSEAAVVIDAGTVNCRRSSSLAVPGRCQGERIPLTRQRSTPGSTTPGGLCMDDASAAAASGTVSLSTNAGGYGSTMAANRARSMRSGSAIESTLRPTGCEAFVGGRNGGRYLVVADSLAPWDRCRTPCIASALSSSGSCAGSEVMLQPPSANVSGSGDDDTDSTNPLQFGGGTVSQLQSPGGASSLSVGGLGAPNADDRSRFRYNRSFTFRRGTSTSSSGGTGSRRSATSPDKGRRAVQVLGILFAVFVACYLPFFAVYVIKGTCGQRCLPYLPPRLLVGLEWLAYSGSMLNPIIYHVFNPDFRRAFENLLRCRCRRLSASAAAATRRRATTAAGTGGRRSVFVNGRQNGTRLSPTLPSPIVAVSPPSTNDFATAATGATIPSSTVAVAHRHCVGLTSSAAGRSSYQLGRIDAV